MGPATYSYLIRQEGHLMILEGTKETALPAITKDAIVMSLYMKVNT